MTEDLSHTERVVDAADRYLELLGRLMTGLEEHKVYSNGPEMLTELGNELRFAYEDLVEEVKHTNEEKVFH